MAFVLFVTFEDPELMISDAGMVWLMSVWFIQWGESDTVNLGARSQGHGIDVILGEGPPDIQFGSAVQCIYFLMPFLETPRLNFTQMPFLTTPIPRLLIISSHFPSISSQCSITFESPSYILTITCFPFTN